MKKVFLALAACFGGSLYAQNVNQFTGAFSYNFPLMNLPSNRGNAISLNANYSAGIQMNQPASEIGLGWSLDAGGAIYRSVSGFPDDSKTYNTVYLPSGQAIPVAYGALYPAPATGVSDYDVTSTNRGLDTAQFTMPAYDSYNVVGPVLSGELKLSYLKFYGYDNSQAAGPPSRLVPNSSLVPGGNSYYRKPQFHFSGDFADTLVSRHYPSTLSGSTSFQDPTATPGSPGFSGSSTPYIGQHLSGSTISNQNFDITTGRLATSNFVEYFTNGALDTAINNSFSTLGDFMDYTPSHNRWVNDYPPEGIGAFRITASNGMTYHYSLPVYELENIAYSTPLNSDYSMVANTDTANFFDDPSYPLLSHIYNNQVYIRNKSFNKFAVKWLLTAITGPDFVDDGDHVVDDGDKGYWVSYDYEQWSTGFVQRSPYYGYDYQFNPDLNSAHYPQYFPFVPNSSSDPYKLSGLYAAVNVSKTQTYYLSKIRTSSHTAVFIRDIRNDEKGGDTAAVAGNYHFKPAPSLLTKRIVLFKNEQLDSVMTVLSNTLPAFNTSNYTAFDFTSIANNGNFFTEAWYQTNYSIFSFCILKQVLFDQDYSLCRNYHGNVHVDCAGSSVISSPTTVESSVTNGSYTASGKLTLNRILTYDFQNVKVTPSTKFDYNAANSPGVSNPDYNPRKTDYWGYFKADATQNGFSRYTNSYSRAYTKAWSLLKITDPLGGITQIDYESNAYSKVIDNEAPGGVRGAAYIYRIKQANDVAGGDFIMEEGDATQNTLTEFSALTPANIPGMRSKVFIPFFQSVQPLANSVDPSLSVNPIENGFTSAECTFTIHPISGASNSITTTLLTSTNTAIKRYAENNNVTRRYVGGNTFGYLTSNSYTSSTFYVAYSGNGFLMCEMPVGYEVYGNGIRVKQIKSTNSFNSVNETYVTDYTYENGVATNEMDRFNYQVLKTGCAGSALRYDFLQPKSGGIFDLGAYIGYSKVTVKNLGRISTANGKSETYFITDPSAEGGQFSQNYAVQTVTDVPAGSSPARINVINECINKFSNVFGSVKESRMYDKNNVMLSRTVNEYAPTDQGALVENFYFRNPVYGSENYPTNATYGSASCHTVNIQRDYPVIVKSTTSYGIGGSLSKTESLAKDELTGETTTIRSTAANKSSSLSYKTPAYKYYQPLASVDFTTAAFRKILPLGNDMFTYSNIDSTLTSTLASGYSASFLSAAYKLYSNTILQRQYDNTTGLFTNTLQTLPYYANNRTFVFNAGPGSNDAYGLLAKSNLTNNPLPLSTINNSTFWEPGSSTYNWKLVYENTLLDQYKNLVEIRDANNRFSASRYGYKGYHKTASVSNCNYASFTFAGFETAAPNSGPAMMDGEIGVNNHNLIPAATLAPHTGLSCLEVSTTPAVFNSYTALSPNSSFEIGLQTGRIYRASVWVHNTNLIGAQMQVTVKGNVLVSTPYSINNVYTANSTNNLVTTIGSWNLLQIDFEVPDKFSMGNGDEFSIKLQSAGGTVYFDDFVFHPVESSFSASVYNPRNGRVMSMIDGNGLATGFTYDASGRTTEIWKEVPSVGYKLTKTYSYNYARGAND